MYTKILPRGYTFSFHSGPTFRSLVFRLWSPGPKATLRERSHLHILQEQDIDREVTDDWGLIAVQDTRLDDQDMPIRKIALEEGGL